MHDALVVGLVLGFLTASPVGPIGLLCLRRTLSRGMATGLISALGISLAYAFWSFVAIHGLAAASDWIERDERPLEFVIGLFFLLYGLNGIFNAPRTDYPTLQRRGGLAEFLSTFLVVFLNPATFIMFSALFALFGIARRRPVLIEAFELAAAIFVGAMVFWLLLTQALRLAREYIHESRFTIVSRLSSYAIVLFGAGILSYCLYEYWHPTG